MFTPASPGDAARFLRLAREETTPGNSPAVFGTYNEKTLHRTVRRYVYDNPEAWEVTLPTGAVADILYGNTVIEIQTGSLSPLAKKLERLPEADLCSVVVRPAPLVRRIVKISPDGEAQTQSLSTVRTTVFTLLADAVYIMPLIASGGSSLLVLYIEEDEYRTAGKRHSRIDRIPTRLCGTETFASAEDFRKRLGGLPDVFDSSDFAVLSGLSRRDLYRALRSLELLGIAVRSGKKGNRQLYRTVGPTGRDAEKDIKMATVNVYERYYAARGEFSGVERRACLVFLTADSCDGNVEYSAGVTFFPHASDDDFAVSYDACFTSVLFSDRGRRSKKRDLFFLDHLREYADRLANDAGAEIFWDSPLGAERRG